MASTRFSYMIMDKCGFDVNPRYHDSRGNFPILSREPSRTPSLKPWRETDPAFGLKKDGKEWNWSQPLEWCLQYPKPGWEAMAALLHELKNGSLAPTCEATAAGPCPQVIWRWSKPISPFWDRCTTHFRTDFSGDWDVHWGYGVLTHGHLKNVSCTQAIHYMPTNDSLRRTRSIKLRNVTTAMVWKVR